MTSINSGNMLEGVKCLVFLLSSKFSFEVCCNFGDIISIFYAMQILGLEHYFNKYSVYVYIHYLC